MCSKGQQCDGYKCWPEPAKTQLLVCSQPTTLICTCICAFNLKYADTYSLFHNTDSPTEEQTDMNTDTHLQRYTHELSCTSIHQLRLQKATWQTHCLTTLLASLMAFLVSLTVAPFSASFCRSCSRALSSPMPSMYLARSNRSDRMTMPVASKLCGAQDRYEGKEVVNLCRCMLAACCYTAQPA